MDHVTIENIILRLQLPFIAEKMVRCFLKIISVINWSQGLTLVSCYKEPGM